MADHPGVHLIGSVAMETAEQVFRALAAELGPWLRRLPDGETGERHRWIYWQREMLLAHADMELDPEAAPLDLYQWDGQLIRRTELVRFKPGTEPGAVTFDTGYAAAALASWETFKRLQGDGVIPEGVRFQVCLPTPMASGTMYVSPASLAAYLVTYERALLAALDDILAAVPHQDLSIQWDICQEVLIFEDYFPARPKDYKAQIFAEMARLGGHVPAPVELGYHLCYGTPKDEHLVMPADMGILVELANGLARDACRPIDFVHMPVPKHRDDATYFAPLGQLALDPATSLYLGLIHFDDHAGDMARIRAAAEVVAGFGLSSECGWGRTDPDHVPGLIAAHARAMQALES